MASSYFSTNSNTDFFIGAQLTKSIHTNDKNLERTPAITAHAESQYFYQEYYKFNRIVNLKDNANGQNQQISITVVGIDEVNKFNIINIELRIPTN
jgi:hypothetical protein